MAISYHESLNILRSVGLEWHAAVFTGATEEESVPIAAAVGRICKYAVRCDAATPPFDTSAMDGYALCSASTREASTSHPITFCVEGTMAAGDRPTPVSSSDRDADNGCYHPCVEIMTGAQFPTPSTADHPQAFDACVRLEDTIRVTGPRPDRQYVQVTAPVRPYQNRRFAGTDFKERDLVVEASTLLQPQHVMALASVGVGEIVVFRRLRVAVWSLGTELRPHNSPGPSEDRIRDVNGPYLTAALRDMGADAEFLGILEDNIDAFATRLTTQLTGQNYDLMITTGAVSVGRFDFVREGLERVGATIRFHGVAVKPGHPILFATLPPGGQHNDSHRHRPVVPDNSATTTCHRGIAFFGLPGNPVATAVGLRFFVIPYLDFLHARTPEIPRAVHATTRDPVASRGHNQPRKADPILSNPSHNVLFRHSFSRPGDRGCQEAVFGKHQGSGTIKPLLAANGWLMVPAGHGDVKDGDLLPFYPLLPDRH